MKRKDIVDLFQNEKVGEIFSNSEGGQGLIVIEIERSLTFIEINEIVSSVDLVNIKKTQDIIEQTYPFSSRFIEKFLSRIVELNQMILNMESDEFILSLINENKDKIHDYFLKQKRQDSFKEFLSLYLKKINETKGMTYFDSKRFILNPLNTILHDQF